MKASANPFRWDGLDKDVTIREIAQVLGLSTQAVYSWAERLPELRRYQLEERKPEWFAKKKVKA